MDFARKQLEKYGWKEGEGLGKKKSGISKALKPKLKFDTGGLGHDVFGDISDTWWEKVYNDAAQNLTTKKNSDNSVRLEVINDSTSTKTLKRKKSKKDKNYGNYFVKTDITNEVNEGVEMKKYDCSSANNVKNGICELSDEELLKICGGRTAHKGARHGLKMNAKLARLEEQELNLGYEDKLNTVGKFDSGVKDSKKKKKKLGK